MIIKTSERPIKGSSFRDLIVYMNNGHGEEILHRGQLNMYTENYHEQIEEMDALASVNVRVKDPLAHIIMSWREGEIPTKKQMDDAVNILVREYECRQCKVIYTAHQNTNNVHLHVCINRIDIDTYKSVQLASGWTKKANERSSRFIEKTQGWEIEKSGKYFFNGDQLVEKELVERSTKITQKACDYENLSGAKSVQRKSQELIAPILFSAKSWNEIHQKLAYEGFKIAKKGSGGILVHGDVVVKISQASQKLSMKKLEDRIGSFCEAYDVILNEEKITEEALRETPTLKQYLQERRTYFNEKKSAFNNLKLQLNREQKELKKQHKNERESLYNQKESWRGQGSLLNALKSVLAAHQLTDRQNLRKNHELRRDSLRKTFKRGWPNYEEWLTLHEKSHEAEVWRYRNSLPGIIEGTHYVAPKEASFSGLVGSVKQTKGRWSVEYKRHGVLALVDQGRRINIVDWREKENIVAAMQLAVQKWGSVTLYGSDTYKKMALQVAVGCGVQVTNPDLTDEFNRLKEERAKEKTQAMKDRENPQVKEALDAFEKYHAGVNADRYRVTVIKMRDDGTKKTAILDRIDGVTKGFTADEIRLKMAWFKSIEARGENLYYTPISEAKHHILIDDLSGETLKRLLSDGYKPAFAQQSSPGNYQVLLNVPKQGGALDRQVANDLIREINKLYGDPKISGAIHPHRAPGFTNRKQKHRRDDGTYPIVEVIGAEDRICDKALDRSKEIYQQYKEEDLRRSRSVDEASANLTPTGDPTTVFLRHAQNILAHAGAPDWNRVDSMIALRMAVTGWSQAQIEDAIRVGAPSIRPSERREDHKWPDYARRTAAYPWSLRGERDKIQWGEKYRNHWLNIEGRGVRKSQDRERSSRE